MISFAELLEMLRNEDEVTVLELLDISTEELLEAFKGKLKKRRSYVEKFFDDELTEEEEAFGQGVVIETWHDQVPFDSDYE